MAGGGSHDSDDYYQARIPRVLKERILRLIEDSDEGLTSPNNFIAEAVRDKLVTIEERVMRRRGYTAWLEEQAERQGKRS